MKAAPLIVLLILLISPSLQTSHG